MLKESQQFIGIKCIPLGLPTKQEALLFDRIGIISFDSSIEEVKQNEVRADLEWLLDQGFVFDLPLSTEILLATNDPVLHSCLKTYLICVYIKLASDRYPLDPAKSIPDLHILAEHVGLIDLVDEIDFTRYAKHLRSVSENEFPEVSDTFVKISLDIMTRAMTVFSRQYLALDCVPALDLTSPFKPKWLTNWVDQTIIHVVLDHFPVPADNIPWNDIIEFKNNSETQSKFFQMRHWMKRIAKGQIAPKEVSEEIEFLVNDYTEYLRIQKMKFSTTSLQFFLTTMAGITEDIIKLRLEAAINRFFSVRQRRVALMEAERTAPGREVAYLVKTREKFSD